MEGGGGHVNGGWRLRGGEGAHAFKGAARGQGK